jgi:predicted site-specific integrase-resolvase
MYQFMTKEELSKFIAAEIINSSEAIELLGCSRQNLNDLIQRGKIVPIKEMKRDRLFFKEDIMARINQKQGSN